jgi:response regulator NasT
MKPSVRSLRIAVADDERDMRMFFQELLPPLGHQVVAISETGQQLVEQCRATRPDLVITDIKMPDMDGIAAAAALNQERQVPVILITAYDDADIMTSAGTGCIMAYLTKPIKPADLQAAIALAVMRFEQFRQLNHEAATARQALDDRKVIERAKGIVMKRLQVEEEEAFRRLRKVASNGNRKVIEVAQQVANSEEIFRHLERTG